MSGNALKMAEKMAEKVGGKSALFHVREVFRCKIFDSFFPVISVP